MLKQFKTCLSTAIYIDAIFSYLIIFLKMHNRRKLFGVFIYIILGYMRFVLRC